MGRPVGPSPSPQCQCAGWLRCACPSVLHLSHAPKSPESDEKLIPSRRHRCWNQFISGRERRRRTEVALASSLSSSSSHTDLPAGPSTTQSIVQTTTDKISPYRHLSGILVSRTSDRRDVTSLLQSQKRWQTSSLAFAKTARRTYVYRHFRNFVTFANALLLYCRYFAAVRTDLYYFAVLGRNISIGLAILSITGKYPHRSASSFWVSEKESRGAVHCILRMKEWHL